jgi:hypothetical protein
MRRVQDWQVRFADICNERKDAKFVWGSHDCCLWAADVVLALTGTDFGKPFRGQYDSALGAARVLEQHGGVEAIATKSLGNPIPTLMAGVGDIVAVEVAGRKSLAVCNGAYLLAPGLTALELLGFDAAVAAWKV